MNFLPETDDGLYGIIYLDGLPKADDTLKHIDKVYNDIPQLFLYLLKHIYLSNLFAQKAQLVLDFRTRALQRPYDVILVYAVFCLNEHTFK